MKQQILQSALDRLREAWLEIDEEWLVIDEASAGSDRLTALSRFMLHARKVFGDDLYDIFPDRDEDR